MIDWIHLQPAGRRPAHWFGLAQTTRGRAHVVAGTPWRGQYKWSVELVAGARLSTEGHSATEEDSKRAAENCLAQMISRLEEASRSLRA